MITVRRTEMFAYVPDHPATHGGSFDVKQRQLLVQVPKVGRSDDSLHYISSFSRRFM
jgi:hypothetical protein